MCLWMIIRFSEDQNTCWRFFNSSWSHAFSCFCFDLVCQRKLGILSGLILHSCGILTPTLPPLSNTLTPPKTLIIWPSGVVILRFGNACCNVLAKVEFKELWTCLLHFADLLWGMFTYCSLYWSFNVFNKAQLGYSFSYCINDAQ